MQRIAHMAPAARAPSLARCLPAGPQCAGPLGQVQGSQSANAKLGKCCYIRTRVAFQHFIGTATTRLTLHVLCTSAVDRVGNNAKKHGLGGVAQAKQSHTSAVSVVWQWTHRDHVVASYRYREEAAVGSSAATMCCAPQNSAHHPGITAREALPSLGNGVACMACMDGWMEAVSPKKGR